jgi:hypothetical protein
MLRTSVPTWIVLAAAIAVAGCGASHKAKVATAPAITTSHDPLNDPAEPERSARRGGRLVADYVDLWSARFVQVSKGRLHRPMIAMRTRLTRLTRSLRGPKAANYQFLANRMRWLGVPMSATYDALYGHHRTFASLPAGDRALWTAINELDYVLLDCWQQTAPGQPWKIPALLRGTHHRRLERAYERATRLRS